MTAHLLIIAGATGAHTAVRDERSTTNERGSDGAVMTLHGTYRILRKNTYQHLSPRAATPPYRQREVLYLHILCVVHRINQSEKKKISCINSIF